MIRRRQILAVSGACAGMLVGGMGYAQSYPQQAIKVVVPWPPGGNADVTIRPILDRMSQILGQAIVVENKAGATGNVGSAIAARAKPDGYNLLQLSSSTILNSALTQDKSYDLIQDFTPIGLAASTPMVLEVHPSVPAKSLPELIAYAKNNPGKLSYATAGIGTTAHLITELLKQKAGIDMVHIPYVGGAHAVTDLLGGHVHVYFDVLPTALPPSREGRLRILGITSGKRSPMIPEIPTFAEMGLPEIEASVWVALVATKGTPPAVISLLNDALNRALAEPTVIQRLQIIGADALPGTPEKLGQLMRSDADKWREVVRRANIKAQ